MTNKKTGKYKKKSTKKNQAITDSEIKKGYTQYFRNKRLVEAGETFRSRKRTGPQKSPVAIGPVSKIEYGTARGAG